MNAQTGTMEHSQVANQEVSASAGLAEDRIAELRDKFVDLAKSLELAKSGLLGRGTPPNHGLVFEIGEVHRAFIRLRADLIRDAKSRGIDVPPLDRLVDLEDLSRLTSQSVRSSPKPEARHPEPVAEVKTPEEVAATPSMTEHTEDPEGIVVAQIPAPEISGSTPEHHLEPITEEPVFLAPHARADEASEVNEPVEEVHRPHEISTATVVGAVPESADPAGQATKDRALRVLGEIAALRMKDPGEFEPLATCKADALRLTELISQADANNIPAEATSLAADEHPLSSLLLVVEGVGDLTDAQWANHHAAISETFGRSMAVAAARGRLMKGE